MRALSTKELLSCILIWMFLVPSKSWAQVEEGNRFSLSGIVKDESGNLLDNAHVSISETDMRMDTDHSGAFRFDVAAGTYTISVSKVGFSSEERQVKIKERNSVIEFVLSEAAYTHLEGATVVGKTALQEVRETAYNVTALDAKAFHNTTLDLAHLLNKSSGVKIRETGGMGSSYSINLNGFTGRHVKVFMDGVPMEGMGSSFQLNNIPINLAERIEIYKGVVPIELGADALGGAINVITNKRNKSYADISYSFGSFNTHKTNVNLGYGAKNGFTVQLNAFQNYSDNNYRVLTQNWNPEDRTFSNDSVWVKRFHDGYRNETIGIKTGFVNTDWADQLLFGITLGQERDDIQHSNLMKVVFGAKERKSNTIMPSLSYAKRDFLWEGMNVRVNAQYNRNYNQNIDTSAFEYDWYGTAFRQNDGKVGEANNTLAEFFNRNANVSLNSNYQINEQHSVAINEVWSTYRRNNADKNALITETDLAHDRSSNYKNVLGLSYKFNYDKKWVSTFFGKHYIQHVKGPVNVGSTDWPKYEQGTNSSKSFGYGLATTYFFNHTQLKFSAEQAVRMPTENELLGDQLFERANVTLRPESSKNLNLGIAYQKDIDANHAVYFDASGVYRNVKDFIQRSITPRAGEAVSMNHGKVQNLGINFEGRYYFQDMLTIGGTFTYQSLLNKEKYEQNGKQLSIVYNDRMPNQPYLYGNGEVEFRLPKLGVQHDLLTFAYNINYVHSFFLHWESLGSSSTKDIVDRQLSHDILATYTMQNGRYNLTFEARNITDQLLYDNFSLQKPGRSFAMKLRYFFM